ncbi:MAG: hypothetical protein KIT80_10045 [Chitinophagaceae bacterium]|nr:hypothetical protein [Chitinophagaceae bacterium]MCW5927241.1 hypothetical protein [Chitinophagaceae bacterium]
MRIFYAAVTLFFGTTIASCGNTEKKRPDHSPTDISARPADHEIVKPAPKIIGFWEGQYLDSAREYKEGYYGFLFRPDGTIRIYIDLSLKIDTALTEGKVETFFTVDKQSGKANIAYVYHNLPLFTLGSFNTDTTVFEGSFGQRTDAVNRGKFKLVKQ